MDKSTRAEPVIVEFQKDDAQKLAELLNTFDRPGLWPGGFTGGMPFTVERVLDSFPVALKHICILISTMNGKFTGICSLHPHYEDSDAAYIGLLGVHPDYLGKGHGKALILKAIQIAKENKIKRVDLDTWAGNLRAVPLYKKCGMFWVPDTSVRMQDYIPGILSFPLAKQFFDARDWYTVQRRELKPVPDKFKIDEMELFSYEFSKDEDYLRIYVDRYGRSISGIERTIENETISILAKLRDHKIIAGIEQEFTIDLKNDTDTEIHGSLFLTGFEGLTFTAQPQQSFTIHPGKPVSLRGRFVVSPETEIPDITRKQKTIKANLIVNGELVPLEIGLRILPLLEYKVHPENLAFHSGAHGRIHINVFNNSKNSFKGKVFLIDELRRLALTKDTFPIEIPPRSHSGFPVQLGISEVEPTCAIPLKLFAKGRVKNSAVQTKAEQTQIRCIQPGDIVHYINEDKRGKAIVVENENILTQVRLRGGALEITHKRALRGPTRILAHGGFGIGPPYGFTRPIDYDYDVMKGPNDLRLALHTMYPDKPGVKLERILTFYSGTSLIKDQIRVINTNPEVSYKINARVFGRLPGLLYRLVVPLGKILEHELVGFPVSQSDLPDDPKKYGESWACFENSTEGFCFGQLWSNEKLFKMRFGRDSPFLPEYELGVLEPGESACTSEFYYVIERGTWHIIREKWKSLIAKSFTPKEKDVIDRIQRLFDARLTETAFLDTTAKQSRLELVNRRNKPATGRLHLIPPTNWKIQPSEIEVKDVTMDNLFSTTVTIVPPSNADLGVYSGAMRFSAEDFETSFPLDFCILSKSKKSSVQVVAEKEENMSVFKILNGLTLLKASADFAGCLYFLGKTAGTNQLDTSFPNIQTKVFLENSSGGVRLLYLDDTFGFEKSKTHRESFSGQPIEEGLWKGVCFSFETKEQEETKSLRGSISFLTLPHSNIVRVKREFKNPTTAAFGFNSCLWISPKVGGDFLANTAIFPRGDKILEFKRAEKGFAIAGVTPERGWIYIANNEKTQGLGIVAGNTDKSIILSLDIGKTMLELFILSKLQILPKETCELNDYLVLGDETYSFIEKMAHALREVRT